MSSKNYVFKPFKVFEVKYRGFDYPRPRSGHRIVCDDVNIYCFGGYNPFLPLSSIQRSDPTWTSDKPVFKELWSFSIARRRWKQHKVLKNMPEELASIAMCMNGRQLMIFGGTGVPFGAKCNKNVIIWRVSRGPARLQVLPLFGNNPPGMYGTVVFCHKGYFYTIGGTDGFEFNCDIYRLNMRTLAWESVYIGTGGTGQPIERYRHEVAKDGEKVYVIGGGTADLAFDLSEIPMYDLDNYKWSILTSKPDDSGPVSKYPMPRKCHSAVQIETATGTQVFVVGGTNPQYVFGDIWRLNLSDLQWTLMKKTVLPHPLYFHSATVTSGGCMYIFGGIEPKRDSLCRQNILYKVWLCIPKLSEICWEAMLHMNKNLCYIDKNTLLASGIPIKFVDRIYPPYM